MGSTEKNRRVPNISPKFFWEYLFDEIDWEGSYKMTIGRIIERGGQKEIDEIVRFYGLEKVIRAICKEILSPQLCH